MRRVEVSGAELFALAILVLTATLFTSPVVAEPAPLEPVERPDDELLILELRLGRTTLYDGLLAYLEPGTRRLFLPLGETAAALGLAITTDPGAGTAEGWFLAENRRFSLDVTRRRVVVEGRVEEVPEGHAEVHVEDVFVTRSLLTRWFPVDLELELSRSRILVAPREKLPLERRLERQRTWRRLGGGGKLGTGGAGEGTRYPRLDLPYRLFDWPVVDHRLRVSLERDPDRATGPEHRRFQSDLLATGDFLKMNAELTLGLRRGDVPDTTPDVRLKLGRTDPEGGLLGVLRATEFTVGDLLTPGRSLVATETFARGVEISSFPPDRPEEFDKKTLTGPALPGWEAELYQNGELIDVQIIGDDARYTFADVPLYVGLNLLRIVFHGPQGERRETVERVLIGEELIRPGEGFYRVAAHQHDRRLVSEPRGVGFGGLRKPVTGDAAKGEPRLFAEFEQGFDRGLSLGARFHSLPLGEGERHDYAGLSLLGTRRGILGRADIVADLARGWAGRLRAEGHLSGLRFRLEHQRFSDFVSEEADPNDPPRQISSFQLNAQTPGFRGRPLKIFASAVRDERLSGTVQTSLRGRLSASFGRLALTHRLELRERRGGDAPERELGGAFLAAGRLGKLRLRGGVGYTVEPETALSEAAVTVDWRLRRDLSTRLKLQHGLAGDVDDALTASLSWQFRPVILGVDLRLEDGGGLRSSLSLSYSLRRDPHGRRLRPRARPSASQGALAARVFLDRDADGVFGPADEPLPDVRLTVGGMRRPDRTDARGIVLLDGLESHRPVDVGLELASLDDPYWMPRRSGVGLLPRPGRVAAVDFPVVVTGEVDGTVRLERDGRLKAVSRVEIELVDPSGAVAARTTSAYDGFYLFAQILPGRYRVRIAPEQLERLALEAPEPRAIEIGAEGTVVAGIDFELRAAATRENGPGDRRSRGPGDRPSLEISQRPQLIDDLAVERLGGRRAGAFDLPHTAPRLAGVGGALREGEEGLVAEIDGQDAFLGGLVVAA